ncbi:MAG: class I SAM-dependent methyltransferase [Candidatus Poribacteria bacterium]|jgi:caffeoyl-CoA O-methyltransferase|nr:class I SAM-dependent methyltransferase [Candidatus Poribacteria bacterium]MDP7628469.1 class I SAM-dependent methyltransferase [SAR202 cluster bacterium]
MIVSPDIEKYAQSHTSSLPAHISDLVRFTLKEMEDAAMLSGLIEGTLLQFLVRASGAHSILEIGCFTGFSAQMMASALPADGKLITCEIDPYTASIARKYFDAGPNGDKIEISIGPATETLKILQGPFDLVFIDADKTPYIEYYERSMELLAEDGLIVVDNVLWGGAVMDPKTDSDKAIAVFNEHVAADKRVQQVILTVRDGVMLIRKS